MEEDERREAAIASTPSLQPNFKPSSGVTKQQLSKFQELHERRLQIKSKIQKKAKGTKVAVVKSDGEELSAICKEDNSSIMAESCNSILKHNDGRPNDTACDLAPVKRQKLHWGLDIKERWERKANM